eukprot:9404518-Pyramimonas_sp.AAC.1
MEHRMQVLKEVAILGVQQHAHPPGLLDPGEEAPQIPSQLGHESSLFFLLNSKQPVLTQSVR